MCVFLGPQIQFLGGKPKADYLVGVYLLGVYNILTTLLGCIYLINTLLGCIYLINTLLGCIHLIPCWCVLPSTEAQMPFPHHVSAVARLLQKHWQHWKSCLKYFRKFLLDIGCIYLLAHHQHEGVSKHGAVCQGGKGIWGGDQGYCGVSLWEILPPFHIFLFCTLQRLVYIISKIEQLLCVIKLRFKQSSRWSSRRNHI